MADGGGGRQGEPRRLVVLGTDRRARELARRLTRDAGQPARIVAHVPLDAQAPSAELRSPVIPLAGLPELLSGGEVDEVVALRADCPEAIAACAVAGVPLTLVSELPGAPAPVASMAERGRAQPARALGLGLKRGLDVIGAAGALLVAGPAIGLAALAIQLAAPGPPVRREPRCGLHGRRFALYRLRTRDASGARGPVGRLVHELGIDDALQLWNVLRGDMSLVGPRPPRPSELSRLGADAARQLSMRPGLTCLWQLRAHAAPGEAECAKLDLQYVDGWSLRTDLKILALTVPSVLRGACD